MEALKIKIEINLFHVNTLFYSWIRCCGLRDSVPSLWSFEWNQFILKNVTWSHCGTREAFDLMSVSYPVKTLAWDRCPPIGGQLPSLTVTLDLWTKPLPHCKKPPTHPTSNFSLFSLLFPSLDNLHAVVAADVFKERAFLKKKFNSKILRCFQGPVSRIMKKNIQFQVLLWPTPWSFPRQLKTKASH